MIVYAVEYVDYEGWIEAYYNNRKAAEAHFDAIVERDGKVGSWSIEEYDVLYEYTPKRKVK